MDTHRALTWTMGLILVSSFLGVVYFASTPQAAGAQYTEFYVLGSEGNASNYPTNLTVNESGTVIVGVANQEGQSMTYTVVVRLGGELVTREDVTLESGESWEQRVTFTVTTPGTKALQLYLYTENATDGSEDPYRQLRLWISTTTVTEESSK